MDESTRLLLDLTRNAPLPPSDELEAMNYDIASLLAEGRERMYTEVGRRLTEGVRETRLPANFPQAGS